LAGIRAAVLWRQVGGNRVRLLFGRKRAVAAAETALGYMDPDG
jgi:high frequency lysogenization protein